MDNTDLTKKKCVPCEGGVPPMEAPQIKEYMAKLKTGWLALPPLAAAGEDSALAGSPKKIRKEYKFKNFEEAMAFVNKVAEIAQKDDHHPDIHVFYNRVQLELWTHAIGGLSENDFIVAAKVDALG
ncbi:MAG TPA: 4a-hydroxytetrahydrobiopterin dehydratase [Candidatus Paceibacterota bacterium]|nr:4a-hydroxytetrahydrobiopterin dehydratase [Candidatus Paceibacterota bacterium]